MIDNLERLRKYIVDYQNYEGARVLASEIGLDDEEVRALVGDFFFDLYKMDPRKRFAIKVRRGYWRDDPSYIRG